MTKIIAHRGYSAVAPENTMASFKKALEVGAKYIELDIHLSQDNQLIVIHDDNLKRTSSTGVKQKILKLNSQQLSEIRVGYPQKFNDEFLDEKIPLLRDVLELVKDRAILCIEIKALNAEKILYDLLVEFDMLNQVMIFSEIYSVLKNMRQISSDVKLLLLADESTDETLKQAKEINAYAIGAGPKTIVCQEFLAKIHANFLELWKWTVNDESEKFRLINLGIDALITDYPDYPKL